jgi:transposase
MSNSKVFREKKEMAFEAFISGKTSPKELAALVGCSPVTVSKWIAAGKWDKIEGEERRLSRKITVARRKALLTALEEYAKDPKNTALQSLVSILRQEMKQEEPAKELCDYIVKFLDQVTDFMIEKGYEGLLKQFQAIVMDLAEYLRMRNG